MVDTPQTFRGIAEQLSPEPAQIVEREKITIVPKGPEMTPEMEDLLKASLLDLMTAGVKAFRSQDQLGVLCLIKSEIRFIRTLYLGTNPAMLKHYEQAERLKNSGHLIEEGDHENSQCKS